MRQLWTVPAALGLAALTAGVAAAQGDTPTAPATALNIAARLAPIVAASLVVERSLEAVFNFSEATLLKVIARLAMGADWLGWAVLEIDNAQGVIRATSAELRRLIVQERVNPPQTVQALTTLNADKQALMTQLDQAEAWLRDAEQRLQDVTKTANYRRVKQVASLGLGVAGGVVLAFLTRLDMLELLGLVAGPSILGFLLTGLIIGTGSAPVHSLVALLQQLVNAVDQTRALLNGKALQNAAQALVVAQGGGVPRRPVGAADETGGGEIDLTALPMRTRRTLTSLIDD